MQQHHAKVRDTRRGGEECEAECDLHIRKEHNPVKPGDKKPKITTDEAARK